MTAATLNTTAQASANYPEVKPGGRSKTVAKMMLSNKWATTAMALLLPLLTSALLVGITIIWMLINDYPAEAFITFFNNNLILPMVMVFAFATTMFMFVSGNLKLTMGMGFSRKDIWWAVLKVSAINALIATLVIAAFSAIEIYTQGYGVLWQVFSGSMDLYTFYLNVEPYYGFKRAVISFLALCATWFCALLLVQIMGALLAVVRIRFGTLATGLLAIGLVIWALSASQELFGSINWDLGISDLYYPYHAGFTYGDDGTITQTLELNNAGLSFVELQAGIDNGTTYVPQLSNLMGIMVVSPVILLGSSVILYLLGYLTLRKTDLR